MDLGMRFCKDVGTGELPALSHNNIVDHRGLAIRFSSILSLVSFPAVGRLRTIHDRLTNFYPLSFAFSMQAIVDEKC